MSTVTSHPADSIAAIDDKTIKCIRCGFCLDACPTFRLTGMETRSPRGRIYLVKSWRQGTIPFDSNVMEALDSCLGCRACETACPSGVQYGSILEMARSYIETSGMRQSSQSFARKQLLSTLTSPGKLAASLKAASLMGKFTGGKLPGFAAKMLTGSSAASVTLPLPSSSGTSVQNLPENSLAQGRRRRKVGILAGCVMRVMFGDINAATVRVLQVNGCDVISPAAAGCCGALHLHTGFHNDGLEKAKQLIDAFYPILDSMDAIIINSAGCGSTIKEYGDLFAGDPAYAQKAARVAAKAKDISEWLIEIGIMAPAGKCKAKVAYHDACHLAHGQKVRQQPRELLKSIPGVTMVELDEADTCCGSAGIYNITEPEMAGKLLERKLNNIRACGAEIIAAANPGCLAWLQQGARDAGLNLRICHPVELLDESYRQEKGR
jgi:glycolate oxidase iron-sulfur subunit